ncbi:mucin-2 isoform X4 [Drosophila montana]|uniref:mucin-2 isoform X4 n=1 Tax=Drosophila montana TaxID=40370 RepID=UPI00313DDFAA
MRNTNSNMQFSTHRRSLYWLLGLCLLLFETGLTNAQSKRAPRVTNSRSFGTNVKSTSSNGVSFDCPEEFGYYPHPTDCTQYYVCVFGGALLESCTGGLMYSHELQTCDWPRNVGCELVDSGTSATSTEVGGASRNKPQQHVPSRIRFGAAFTSPAATQKTITVPPQYHRSPPQIIQAQVQHIPPPPELAVSPNPVVTSRGQPKSLLDSQEEIAKLYADAQETLPPVEEEESDRQQRVYRGQPSTVSQVQRDRDGILHQASINAIPNHGKIGSYTFGTVYRVESSSPSSLTAQTSDNIFLQPSSQASPPQFASNRNYYNTSIFNHGGGYQTPQQPQAQQQQPSPFQQQPQQQQQQAHALPNPYDSSYYSVYDDDIDLYRDIEYQQQQEQHQQKSQPYQSSVRQQQQSTYRPLEILTTPTPPQRPSYSSQPTLGYNTDYDEDLNAQIEQDNVYDQPTRTPQRSKTHANKNLKQNVIIKLKTTTSPRTTQAPSTTTPTTSTIKQPSLPTYDSNPFLKSKLQFLAKSLISAVAGSQSQNINDTKTLTQVQTTVTPPISESWASVNDSANSSSTQKYVETVYDESQNVHVQTGEISSSRTFETSTSPKFLDFINAAAYGASNLVRAPTEKSFKTVYTRENINNGFEKDKTISTEQNQSKRIQSYVLSDVKPQSFRAITNNTPRAASSDLLDSSSTARPNKAYEYSLESGSHGFTLRAKESLNEENASEPLFERPENGQRLKPNTTTTRLPLTLINHVSTEIEDIIPTTYAPLRIWRNGRPTIKQAHRKPTKMPTLSVTELPSTTAKATTTTIRAPSTLGTSTERASSGQSFTSRANIFKDNLNRATSNPGMRFVSPYKSLESLLQDERLPHNSLRTTTRTRYAPASIPFLQTTPKSTQNNFPPLNTIQNNATQFVIEAMTNSNTRNFSISDVILSTFSPQRPAPSMPRATTTTTTRTTTTNKIQTEAALTTTILEPTVATVVTSPSIQVSEIAVRARGRSRYTAATVSYNLDSVDEPTTYAPKFKIPNSYELRSSTSKPFLRRKAHRGRVASSLRQTISEPTAKSGEKYETYKAGQKAKETVYRYQISPSSAKPITAEETSLPKRNPNENEASISDNPRAEALIAQQPLENKHNNSIEQSISTDTSASSIQDVHVISDRPPVKYLFSNKYRQQTAERTLAESLQNAGYITTANGRTKFRANNVLEQLQHFLSASDSDESGSPQFVDEIYGSEIKASVNEIKPGVSTSRSATTTMRSTSTMSASLPTTRVPLFAFKSTGNPSKSYTPTPTISILDTDATKANISTPDISTEPVPSTTTAYPSVTINSPPTTRVSRVNNALKSSIAAAAAQSSSPVSTSSTYQMPGGRANKFQYGLTSNSNNNNQHQYNNNNAAVAAVSVKCSDSTLSPKCNEIPSRNNNRNRGSAIYTNQDRDTAAAPNRGTHPPRTRPTLKPAGTIVSKAQEFVDIYRYPPTRPDPVYPQPTPDKTAAKCRKDVCLLPDCYCGGRDIPGELPAESIPQIVLLTFDDSVNDLNKQLYTDLFEKGRVNPNGCPITATFYVSHEWTDYSQVQNLYSDGHEMASHTVSHSFGEQFSQKKWTREIAGQREILAAYGGVKLSDVRGMRAPFLSVGGNKMYKMLYDSNFTYDSSMPVYENRPPSWPYTLDYKIFHDCMIPPCPTRSYPGVWQVPMVMWQDLNGGRCSMGDACSNPSDAEGVTKMIMKNFERHYTTNRAPFGLFYHAAWFTQPHHKEGFIKFLDAINAMQDVWIITNWQALQWVRDPTPTSRINSFQPFQCDYSDRPKRCNNPKVCNLWHKSGVRYMKTCQPCPDIYPWTGKSGIRSSRIDNEVVEEPSAQN